VYVPPSVGVPLMVIVLFEVSTTDVNPLGKPLADALVALAPNVYTVSVMADPWQTIASSGPLFLTIVAQADPTLHGPESQLSTALKIVPVFDVIIEPVTDSDPDPSIIEPFPPVTFPITLIAPLNVTPELLLLLFNDPYTTKEAPSFIFTILPF
jgi:hypothetical protein